MSEEKQQTIAEELSAARQARGLNLEEVQRQSGISLAVLQGIEADQFDVIEPVFVRFALKAYAEFLDLDPEPFLTRFDQQQSLAFQPRHPPTVLISQPVPHRSRSYKPLVVIGLVIAACCALAAAFYFFGDRIVPLQTRTQSADPPQATTTPTQATVTPAQSRLTTAPNDPIVAGSSTEPEAAADTSATAVAAQTTTAVVLELEARDSTWVQIRWDNAAENFEGIVPPGERHLFEARDHFVVLSTRPHGLRYWLNGQLLGGGQLGDPNQVLRFRATADGIELLGLDSQPLTEEAPDTQP